MLILFKRSLGLLFLAVSLTGFFIHADAQHFDFAASSGTFTPVTSATALDAIENDDAVSGTIPIGFTFSYYGSNYTQLVASSNGFISFDLTASSDAFNSIGDSFYPNLIAPLWDDMDGTGGTGSHVVTGSSPNRVFTIEWLNWKWSYLASQAGISFQIKLYETSNKIEFVYRQESGALSGADASIGLVGASTSNFYSLASSSASPSFDLIGYDLINAKPATGQIYSFTPGTISAPSTQASAIIATPTGNTMSLSWTNGDGSRRAVFMKASPGVVDDVSVSDGQSYSASASFADFGTLVGSGWYCVYTGTGNSVNVTSLSSGVTYRVRVLEYNGIGGGQKYNTTTATNNHVDATTTLSAPSNPISTLKLYRVSATEITLDVEEGNGAMRAVFMIAGSTGTAPVVDNTTYAASTTFGSGSQVGTSGWYCVFNGASTFDFTVTGLTGNTAYRVYVVDYNGSAGSEKYNASSGTNNPVQFTTFSNVALPTYTFAASSGTFTPVTSANSVDIIENDDALSSVIPLGFTFKLGGVDFTQVVASSNGFLSFNPFTDNLSSATFNDLESSLVRPLVAPLWDDLSGSGGQASYVTTGIAPNRIFTFEWLNWRWDYGASSAGISFQVKLYENDNKVEFIYRQDAGVLSSPSASIGIAFPNFNTGNYLSLNGSGSNPTVSSSLETGSISAKPATGQVYSFTPVKVNQIITFGTLAAKTFGDSDFGLTATASSGLTVSYQSSNTSVATVSGSTVTIVGAGTATITASQAGDGYYNPATSVGQALTVNKVNQTITFTAPPVKTFGDANFNLTASVNSPLALTLSSSNTAVATISGNTVTIVGAGTTDITASQAGNSNYNAATPVIHTLTVSKANQTITFTQPTAKTFGDAAEAVFNLVGSATSGLAVTYISSNTAVATISGTTVTIVGAGTTDITASQAGNSNYNAATTVIRTLTVNKANQTITFTQPAAKNFGDAAFNLTGSSTSGLTVSYASSNTAVATVSGNTVTIVGVGSTDITASQAGNTNYNAATPVIRTLTVNKGNQTITFADLASKTFGDAAFDLTATSSSGLSLTYASSNTNVATVSGNTITILAAGTTDITASQSGTSNYNAATPVIKTLTVNKSNQIISFAALPSKVIGDAAFSLTATASSTLPVTFSSSNTAVATISGNTVTIVGAGTTNISASQAGNSNINAAPTVTHALIVKGTQTLTFNALVAKTFGDAAFNLTATASSGLTVSYSSSNTAVATISNNTVTIVGAGTTNITASQAGDANFTPASSVMRTLTVNKANQTIAFATPADKKIGDAAFSLSASSSSGLPLTFTTTSDKITLASNQVTIVKAGAVTILIEQGGNANYNAATSVSVTFCIKPTKPVISASGLDTEAPVLTSNSATGNQWFKDGAVIPGATNSTHTVTSAGVYTVVVSADNCTSEASDGKALVVTGVEHPDFGVTVFPNPAEDELIVDVTALQSKTPVSLKIVDVSGRTMLNVAVETKIRIPVRHYSAGNYVLQLEGANKKIIKHFIKK